MHAANPLRQPKPAEAERLFEGRFYLTDENGRLAGGIGTSLCLTSGLLWVTPELAIPLGAIDSTEIIEKGVLPPRRFLQISYLNPISNGRELVCLCKPDPIGIGLYRRKPLEELNRRIGEVRPATQSPAMQPLDACEVCGAKPAWYVSYFFAVSALLLAFRSGTRRRMHCRKHNAMHGMLYYLITALTGWIGLGIFVYPLVVFAAGRNLAPSLGRASWVLGILPTLALAALIASWFF
jgi:hypothetical protein